MRILLVNPNARALRGAPAPPLGILCIASMVKAEHSVKIFDRSIFDDDVKEALNTFKPDLVGVSVLTGPAIADAVAISRQAKQQGIPVIWGGVHPTLLPRQVIAEDYVDFVVIGEGEYTFKELVGYLDQVRTDFENVAGLAYKTKEGDIVINQSRQVIKNLDELPFPAWDLIDVDAYVQYEIPLVTSRGCPWRCAFCYNQGANQRRWRPQSSERVLAEIDYVLSLTNVNHGYLKFYDDNFVANPKRARAILEALPKDMDVWLEMRLDYVKEDFVKLLAEFKGCHVFVGVESGDQAMLDKMQKDLTIEQIEAAFTLFKQYKISTTGAFMIGNPGETYQQALKTIALSFKLNPTRYSFAIYRPFPGTDWYEECVAKGLLIPPERTADWAKISDRGWPLNMSNVGTWFLILVNYLFMIVSLVRYVAEGRGKIVWHKLHTERIYFASKIRHLWRRVFGSRLQTS